MSLLSKLFHKEKKLHIDFCEKNLDRFLTKELFPAYQAFFQKKNIVYKEYQCQSKCEECKLTPYAIVNGEMVKAENSEALLTKLKSMQKT